MSAEHWERRRRMLTPAQRQHVDEFVGEVARLLSLPSKAEEQAAQDALDVALHARTTGRPTDDPELAEFREKLPGLADLIDRARAARTGREKRS